MVLGHAIRGFSNSRLIFAGSSIIDNLIYSFHMPLMFVISGYAFGIKSKFSDVFHRLMKCIVDVYLPCLYLSFLIWLPKFLWSFLSLNNTENFELSSIADLLAIPFHGYQVFWFLCVLFFIKVIHILTEQVISDRKLHVLLWIILFVVNAAMGGQEHSFYHYGLYFHAGYVIRQQGCITQEKHLGASYGAAIFLGGMLFLAVSYFYGLGNIFMKTVVAMLATLGIFILFYALNIDSTLLVTCGTVSMVIYALHSPVISSLRLIFRQLGWSLSVNSAVLFVFCSVVSVAISLSVVLLYRNVKCLRWIEYIFYPGKLIFKK